MCQDFAYVGIDVNLLASSNASDAVLGRLLVAVLQASGFSHLRHFSDEVLGHDSSFHLTCCNIFLVRLQFVAQREKPPRGKALKILMDKIREPPIKVPINLKMEHPLWTSTYYGYLF